MGRVQDTRKCGHVAWGRRSGPGARTRWRPGAGSATSSDVACHAPSRPPSNNTGCPGQGATNEVATVHGMGGRRRRGGWRVIWAIGRGDLRAREKRCRTHAAHQHVCGAKKRHYTMRTTRFANSRANSVIYGKISVVKLPTRNHEPGSHRHGGHRSTPRQQRQGQSPVPTATSSSLPMADRSE